MRNKPRNADIYGVDIGKNIFHIVGVNADGMPIQRLRCRRETLLQRSASAGFRLAFQGVQVRQ